MSIKERQVHASIHGLDNRDKLTNDVMHTLPLEHVVNDPNDTRHTEVCGCRAFGQTSAFADAWIRPRRRSTGADAPPSRDFNRRRAPKEGQTWPTTDTGSP